MQPDLDKLLQLDQVDREVARLRAEVAALPRRVAEIETQLAGVNAAVDKARTGLKNIETARRKREADIQTVRGKISKYRDQSLAVKTNQEYKALLDEISFAESEIRQLEDNILEGMLEAENHEKSLKVAQSEQKRQQAEVEREKEEARKRTQEDEEVLAGLLAQQKELRKGIDANLTRHYDRVLKLRGTALAEARDQTCCACNVQLRPQVYNDVMKGEEVFTCDSCHRILYFIAAPPAAPSENKDTVETTAAAEVPDRN